MKVVVKKLCYLVASVIVSPLVITERATRRIGGRPLLFQTYAQLVSLIPGLIGDFIRNAYYRFTLRRCAWNCALHMGTIFTDPEAEVGTRLNTGLHCVIGLASIGDYTIIAEGAHILSGKMNHGISDPSIPFQDQPGTFERVTIGRNCWLGANSVVMADLGANCIVGAGAVVTRPFPDNKIILGNPARAVAETFSPDAARMVTRR